MNHKTRFMHGNLTAAQLSRIIYCILACLFFPACKQDSSNQPAIISIFLGERNSNENFNRISVSISPTEKKWRWSEISSLDENESKTERLRLLVGEPSSEKTTVGKVELNWPKDKTQKPRLIIDTTAPLLLYLESKAIGWQLLDENISYNTPIVFPPGKREFALKEHQNKATN